MKLFAHNQIAYASAVTMLAETGKAAIIHPTGTGKSFIGFKLCEDNPDKTICWLSPSEYIFKTQIENWKDAGGSALENIRFYTYAKLMNLTEEELADIHPDYIVLDEFHRCGAEMWGQGVQNLLNTYPNIPILGLSATNIRYLDNQRDMADELFDGNVASEMTLGEAIVRGILAAPKYVMSVYSYQKDLDAYQSRIRHAKSKIVRDTAEQYLDALRRALEKAYGLDVIFNKHMTDRTGKYIVFTANIEAMQECIDHVPEWFGKVDAHPHLYSVYSDDPSASKSFAAFKEDNDNTHLRLLFCIDALNEGVHVDNISGVILFRPTISPIIYKQQIGRALSASKKNEPVIFDIVNNFENLYAIGAIEEEMRAAVTYYNYFGDGEEIVAERFQVIDEIRDCRRLFDELEETLTASWDLMFSCAKTYYEENGNLEVPRRYKTADGYALGNWIFTMRKIRAGEQYGNLDENRIAKLDSIGMVWSSVRDTAWEKNFAAAKQYAKENGDLNVKATYVTADGIRLGGWISGLRTCRKSSIQNAYLTAERIAALDKLGMIWSQPDYVFERNYAAALAYYKAHGNLDAPSDCVIHGVKLGMWLQRLRISYKTNGGYTNLAEEQTSRLNELGMRWGSKADLLWEQGFTEAKQYAEQNHKLDVPHAYVSESGYKLGAWMNDQKEKYNAGKLKPERKQRLDDLGMYWGKTRTNDWDECFAHLKHYYEVNGNIRVPANYTANGIWLAKWLNEQKQVFLGKRKGKSLSEEQIAKLESLGSPWKSRAEIAWDKRYTSVRQYFEKHGDIRIPQDAVLADGRKIGNWFVVQRKYRREGKLTEKQIQLLDALGFVWEHDNPWEVGFRHAEEYYKTYGNLSVSTGYVCNDGYRLGNWINNQRSHYLYPDQYHKITEEQTKLLEDIGMIWKPKEERWETSFALAKEYFGEHGNLLIPQKYKTPDGYCLGEWITLQRELKRKGKLEQEKVLQLNSIGMDWLSPTARVWEKHFESCAQYYKEHGDLKIPLSYVEEDGFQLGMWLWKIRAGKSKLKTSGENGNQIERLSSIGMVWKEDDPSASMGVKTVKRVGNSIRAT